MSMDDEVPVKLTDADREARQASLLYHLGEAERLEQKLRDDTSAAKKQIAAEWAECYRLRRVLLDDQENRRQGELFVSDEQATAALAEVAKAAGEGAPLPSEPHDWAPIPYAKGGAAENEPACIVCGANESDPVHHGGEQLLRHVFSPAISESADGPIEIDTCTFQDCGRVESDPLHDVMGESVAEDGPITFTIGPDTPLFQPHRYKPSEVDPVGQCDLCGENPGTDLHQVAEKAARYHRFACTPESPNECLVCGEAEGTRIHRRDAATPAPTVQAAVDQEPVRPCPACKQGTCEVHAHAFEGEDLRCSRCSKVKRAKIHRVEEAYQFTGDEPAPEIASESPLVHGA